MTKAIARKIGKSPPNFSRVLPGPIWVWMESVDSVDHEYINSKSVRPVVLEQSSKNQSMVNMVFESLLGPLLTTGITSGSA